MRFICVQLTFLLAILSVSSAQAATLARPVNIIYTSDMPVIAQPDVGGYPELASVLNHYRAQSDAATFFLFGGNSLAPSPLSSMDRGSHIIDLLNSLEPDVMAVTKREFSYFEDELSLRAYEAAFPIVSSNIYDKRSETNIDGLVDSVIIEQRGIKIGVMSVIDQTAITDYLLTHLVLLDPKQAIIKHAAKLKRQGVDLVVLMYSYNFDFVDQLLNDKVIDLSFITNPEFSTLSTETQASHPNAVVLPKLAHVAIVQGVTSPAQALTPTLSWQVKSLNTFAEDPVLQRQVDGYSSRLNRLLNQPLARVDKPFNTLRSSVRTEQNAFANLLTDTLREFSIADIGLLNGGIIRGNRGYEAGDMLTHRDIAQELPFRSRVAVLSISGAQLIEALENGLSMIERVRGRFPQISGMQVTYDPQEPVNQRVKSVLINGQPLQHKRIYKLATSDYLAEGGDGYSVLQKCPKLVLNHMLAPMIIDVFVDRIRQVSTFSPTLDTRLVNIND